MVPSPCQCPGLTEKVCNCFLPAKDNDPHCFCTLYRGKTCALEDGCDECHDWPDKRCIRVGEYMAKLSLQRERRAEASYSSLLGFPLPCLFPCVSCIPIVFSYCDDCLLVCCVLGDIFGGR